MKTTSMSALNERAKSHQMTVNDAGRFIDTMATSLPDKQFIREMLHNSIHAIFALDGNGVIEIGVVDVEGVPKLAFFDTGCGMSGDELIEYIGNLSSSARTDTDRKGVGSKITGMSVSPYGLEYISYNGVDDAWRCILGRREGTIPTFVLLNDHGARFEKVPVEDLHPEIRKAGHGTMVIVHGFGPDDNTYIRLRDAAAIENGYERKVSNKEFTRYINEKYARIPTGLKFTAAALRSRAADPLADSPQHKTVDRKGPEVNVGLVEVLHDVSAESGTLSGPGWNITWFYNGDKSSRLQNGGDGSKKSSRFQHGDNCSNKCLVAIAFPDSEVPGLSEVYEVHTGKAGAAVLSKFGLAAVQDRCSLLIEIVDPKVMGVSTNPQRTQLVQNKVPVSAAMFAEGFRENMPARLKELVYDAVVSRSIDLSAMFTELLEQNTELFDMFGTSQNTTTVRAPRQLGEGCGTKGVAGAGHREGQTRKNRATPPLTPMRVPDIISWPDVPEEYSDCFAYWSPESNQLLINEAFEQIDRETSWHLKDRSKVADTDRMFARQLVRDGMVLCVLEAIVQIKRRIEHEREEVREEWRGMLKPRNLTVSVLTAMSRKQNIAKEIGRKLGSKTH